jgi:hypothetical protein
MIEELKGKENDIFNVLFIVLTYVQKKKIPYTTPKDYYIYKNTTPKHNVQKKNTLNPNDYQRRHHACMVSVELH